MKYLEPVSIRVNSISVVSHHTVNISGVPGNENNVTKERRLFLGFFNEEITGMDVEKAIQSEDLWSKVVTLDAFSGNSFKAVIVTPRKITEGIVFENTNEFVQYLKTDLYYDDILDGYQRAGEKSV